MHRALECGELEWRAGRGHYLAMRGTFFAMRMQKMPERARRADRKGFAKRRLATARG
jgi:hypothetical protein